jgi:hypothetical protein
MSWKISQQEGVGFGRRPFYAMVPIVGRGDDFPSRINALYGDAVQSLRFFKQQQWSVTNYALAVYAAVYFLRSLTFLQTSAAKALLLVLVCITWFASVLVLGQLEKSIMRDRRRIDRIHLSYFSASEISRLELESPNAARSAIVRSEHLIFWLLVLVSSAGAAMLSLILLYG